MANGFELLSTIDAIAFDAYVHRHGDFVQTPKIFADRRLKERDGNEKDRGRGSFVVNIKFSAIGDQPEQTVNAIPRVGAVYSTESGMKVLEQVRKGCSPRMVSQRPIGGFYVCQYEACIQ
jgi:hypothetical protein